MIEQQRQQKRKWRSEKLPKPLTIRATNEEHTEILRRAALARTSASRYLIASGLKGSPPKMRASLPPSGEESENLEHLLYDFQRAATNLNQITHAIHSSRFTSAPRPADTEIAVAIAALHELTKAIKERM